MQKKDIVKYHNDLNKVTFGNLTAQEQNFMAGLVAKIRDRQGEEMIIFDYNDISSFSQKNLTKRELLLYLKEFEKKLFGASFSFLLAEEKSFGIVTAHLFNDFTIRWDFNDKEDSSLDEDEHVFSRLEISINRHFEYIINNVLDNFTCFEFKEFIGVQGAYNKTLYRLLKQFRNTGIYYESIEKFREKLDIPKSYRMRDIDRQILNPAIKELNPYFKKLKYEKCKSKGKGNKITHIKFLFDTEKGKIDILTEDEQFNYDFLIQNGLSKNTACTCIKIMQKAGVDNRRFPLAQIVNSASNKEDKERYIVGTIKKICEEKRDFIEQELLSKLDFNKYPDEALKNLSETGNIYAQKILEERKNRNDIMQEKTDKILNDLKKAKEEAVPLPEYFKKWIDKSINNSEN